MRDALLQLAADLRATADRLERALKQQPVGAGYTSAPTLKKKNKGPPCKCGHPESEHNEHGCITCRKEGTLGALGCPEFVPKRAKKKMNGALAPCETAILTALAQYGIRTDKQLAVLTGYRLSGTFGAALANLRSAGYIMRGTPIRITDDGKKTIGRVEPLPSGAALFEHWAEKLSPCEVSILEALRAYGEMKAETIAEMTHYQMSGTFSGALATLRKLGLVKRGSPVELADELKRG